MNDTLIIFSKGILKVPFLSEFCNEFNSIVFWQPINRNAYIAGWGFKSSAQRARSYAQANQLPYVALEDGFIRSVGLGVNGPPPLSLVVDDLGIYYDAHQTNKLEQLILNSGELTTEASHRVQGLLKTIRDHKLSKYNQQTQGEFTLKPKVLVIDQTRGDASVTGAMADESSFVDMLNTALANHPDETIWVKVHPDVLCGKKQGFLYPLPFEHPRVKVFTESVNPWDILETVTNLYTVSSLMGFEALLSGVKVHCFGMPFYAGWGLTNDKLVCERRNVKRSVEQIFVAAYLDYARYVDPILAKRCELDDILPYVVDVMRHQAHSLQPVNSKGVSAWKRLWLRPFFEAWQLKNSRSTESALLTWGCKNNNALTIEDGFIRSNGLGVHFNKPMSLVLDRSGIYFDATRPSDLENILNGDISDFMVERARALLPKLLSHGITKYNVGDEDPLSLPQDQLIILVPGQVESDASIQFGSPEVKTNATLLRLVREANPDAFLIYKPHPDVLAGQRDNGDWQHEETQCADLVVTNVAMNTLLDQVDEVHTMTSLTGFEALLRGKRVTTYGMPFYAGWGLTTDRLRCERRRRKLSLFELMAGALILYPTYIDPLTQKLCTVEQAVERLVQIKSGDVTIKDVKLTFFLMLKSLKNHGKRLFERKK